MQIRIKESQTLKVINSGENDSEIFFIYQVPSGRKCAPVNEDSRSLSVLILRIIFFTNLHTRPLM